MLYRSRKNVYAQGKSEGGKMKKRLVAVLLFAVMILSVCACGKKTLESMISQEELTQIETQALSSANGVFTALKIEVKENNLSYRCTLADQYATDEMVNYIKGVDWESQLKSIKDQCKSEYPNLDLGEFSYVFLNEAGNELYKVTY